MELSEEIEKISKSRKHLMDVIERIPAEILQAPETVGLWSIKDVVGHITAWEVACLVPMQVYASGGVFDNLVLGSHDDWNAVQVQKRDGMTTQEVFKELKSVREGLLEAVRKIPADHQKDMLNMPWGEETDLAGMLSGLAWHENEHTKEIRKALDKLVI
jgi:hypothetical protein